MFLDDKFELFTDFKCPPKYSFENSDILATNNASNSVIPECLIVPAKFWNGRNKYNFTVTMADPGCDSNKCNKVGYHGYEIFIFNSKNNIISVNIIKPNFFCIVNTKKMNSNGTIIFNKSLNNKNLYFIILNTLDTNNNLLTKNSLGNVCQTSNDAPKYIYSSDKQLKEISYKGNPRIFFLGDYSSCNNINSNKIYIYFDYQDGSTEPSSCINKLKLSLGQLSTINILENNHAFEYKLYSSSLLNINFDPRNIVGRDGFFAIFNILNTSSTLGSITFSNNIIQAINKKKLCFYIKFWLADINFNSSTNFIDKKTQKGPYKSLLFSGNPKIIIFIPPYIFPKGDKKDMTTQEINYRSLEYVNNGKDFQTNPTVCNIYVNIIY